MKTKFILYGGFNPAETDPDNSEFSKELLREAPEGAKILIVPFAKEVDRWLPTLKRVSTELHTVKWQQSIIIEGAVEENFINQIKSADVIYFQGGSSSKLLETLKKYLDLGNHLQGKIIAGDSGGGNVLCSFFYSSKTDTIHQGLEILPVRMIPHFKEDYRHKFDSLPSELESVFLPEYTYKVFLK